MITCLAMLLKHRNDSIVFHNNFCMLSGQNNPLQEDKTKRGSQTRNRLSTWKFQALFFVLILDFHWASGSNKSNKLKSYLRSFPPVMNWNNRSHFRIVATLFCISKAVSFNRQKILVRVTNVKCAKIWECTKHIFIEALETDSNRL